MSLVESGTQSRLLVIGARGFLGTFVAGRARRQYEVFRGDRSRGDETDVVIDITDEGGVANAFREVRPDAVILLAGISDIDRCQRNPDEAMAVNLRGAENIAHACAASGARLLFTSTAAVFDGLKHGYREEDEVSPTSVYGESKARAEAMLAAVLPTALIVRVSLVLGRTGKSGTNSLVDTMIRRWDAKETIAASVLESRNPIDAHTLSEWFLELLATEKSGGIFHAGATDTMTRYELAKSIADRLQIEPALVKQEFRPAPGRAPRGADHLLLTAKIQNVCPTQPPSCEEVITRSLNEVA